MNSNDGKQEPDDPENAVRMVELELMRQRAALQQASAPYRGLRAASFVFLFVVILAALLAFFYVFSSGGLNVRARNSPQPSPGATAISRTP
jgi:hypothetical protein